MKTLLLIDGHAIIHRAYHALPATMVTTDGIPTNAIYGFFMMLQKVITEFRPTHLAICFDTPKPTFRKKLFTEYQAKRPPLEDTLRVQIPEIKTLLENGGITCLEKPGFEADDVIGTIAEQHKSDFDQVLILTGDRDILQLTDKNVFVITPKVGVSQFTLYTPDNVESTFGVDARHIPDYKALAGDASDNYNTARGIGPKTALKLLDQFPSVEELVSHTSEIENEKWRQILEEHKDTILLFKKIATIVRDVDIKTSEKELQFSMFDEKMKTELRRLQLFTLMKKLFENTDDKPIVKPVKKKKEPPNDQIGLF